MMARKKIIILGAGLAGLSTAWHLQRKKIDCLVLEKELEVGGLCRSKKVNGFTFDYDGHLLHFKHSYAFDLVKELLGDNLAEHKRSAWIYSYGRFTRYPFQANLYGLPSKIVKECLSGFVEARNSGLVRKNGNFLYWIKCAFGEGIARHFMIPYNTKFWNIPPQKITCDWLEGFIPQPTLTQIIEGTIEESKRQFGYNANFWYPKKGGIEQLVLAFKDQISNIQTGCKIKAVDIKTRKVILANGTSEAFDYLVSTVPLPEFPNMIKGMPAHIQEAFKKLRWNSIFNLNLGVEQSFPSQRHWVYFPQKDLSFFRVGFFHNFSGGNTPRGRSSLYAEVSYSEHKPIDKKKICGRIKEDLKKVGLLSGKDSILAADINDIKYGYPIYDKNYARAKKKIFDFLSKNQVIPCGRYGSWRYMSMEDVILEGREIAQKFVC